MKTRELREITITLALDPETAKVFDHASYEYGDYFIEELSETFTEIIGRKKINHTVEVVASMTADAFDESMAG